MSRRVHFVDEEVPYNPLASVDTEDSEEVSEPVIVTKGPSGMDLNQKKLYELQIKFKRLKQHQNMRKYRNWLVKYNINLQHLYRMICQDLPCNITFEQFCMFAYAESVEVPTLQYGHIRP